MRWIYHLRFADQIPASAWIERNLQRSPTGVIYISSFDRSLTTQKQQKFSLPFSNENEWSTANLLWTCCQLIVYWMVTKWRRYTSWLAPVIALVTMRLRTEHQVDPLCIHQVLFFATWEASDRMEASTSPKTGSPLVSVRPIRNDSPRSIKTHCPAVSVAKASGSPQPCVFLF